MVGIGSVAYKIVFMLHILSAIVGFGSVMLNGVYGAEAKKRPGPGGLAIGEANFAVSKVAEKLIFLVPVWGILLVVLSDGVWEFSQPWVMGALTLIVVLLAFALLVQARNAKRMTVLAAELVAAGPPPAGTTGRPPQVAMMEAVEKKLAMGGAFLATLIVLILGLMVFKPGI